MIFLYLSNEYERERGAGKSFMTLWIFNGNYNGNKWFSLNEHAAEDLMRIF